MTSRTKYAVFAASLYITAGLHGSDAATIREDPCETIPRAVVAAVLHKPIVAARLHENDDITSCTFTTNAAYPSVSVGAYRVSTVTEAMSRFVATVDAYANDVGATPRAVGEIGDGAAEVAGLLFARKVTAVYVFQVVEKADVPGDVDAEKKLASAALRFVK